MYLLKATTNEREKKMNDKALALCEMIEAMNEYSQNNFAHEHDECADTSFEYLRDNSDEMRECADIHLHNANIEVNFYSNENDICCFAVIVSSHDFSISDNAQDLTNIVAVLTFAYEESALECAMKIAIAYSQM